MKSLQKTTSILATALILAGCASQQKRPSKVSEVHLQFEAQVNGASFDCQKTYANIGRTKATVSPKDFRFYVSHVQLINEQGEAVPLTLAQDGKWQYQNVTLLDFENKTGTCEGNKPVNTVVKGTVPEGRYRGVMFDLGVPFELNHQDVNQAASPMNLSSLFWVWRSGYKFARLDIASQELPQGYFIHLGSTACMRGENESPAEMAKHRTKPPMSCRNPNRSHIHLPDFQVNQDRIVADLGRLLKDSDLKKNQPQTAAGCMSGMDDDDCLPLFQNFGLAFNGATAKPQTFFRVKQAK